ncbi:prenyltransferase/squalene oxidase repeat-containing protein [Chryseobacterium sp. KCF3-3]|uniref:prenyltransferase/squalene oxidase repeat-containing protein n=1 Tax=Chryseobacterium sp. KCF3-3 TaxID=3231511 RepID=UPI0038B38B60
MSNKEKSPEFYKYYPKLFHDYYPKIEKSTVNILSEAGYSYYQSILKLDSIIDNMEVHKIFNVLNLQEETIKILSSVYPENHIFWKYWNMRKIEYFEAIFLEKNLWENPNSDNYYEVADKKSAFGKVAIDCLYVLSENKDEEVYKLLLESHKYFSIGFQLYDDVMDFSDDFYKKQFNYAVHELSKSVDFSKYNNDVILLHKLLYIEGVGIGVLNKSISYLTKAQETIKGLSEKKVWFNTINDFKQTIIGYRDVTDGYIKTIQERAKIKKIPIKDNFFDFEKIKNDEFIKGLQFIKSDFLKNYAELKHIMYLGSKEEFENDIDIHSSDTFQRALLNDCLLDITKSFDINAKDFFENENQYLLERKNEDEIGAWSYFPTVQEIAADIDDLGQIIQQFIRTDNKHLISIHCLKAINIVINERIQPSGGIETWIIPKDNLTKKQMKQDLFNSTKWGRGADVEVVANFIYALTLFDAEKYKLTISKAINYIISEQKDHGYWEARWYYGKFYGTYVCLRLLNEFPSEYKSSKQKIKNFLINSQNEDGSFDEEQYKNLSTSFAIFCIKLLKAPELAEAKRKAQKYLLDNQLIDGCWNSENFIKPKSHEPYKSKTLSTAYVLKALL